MRNRLHLKNFKNNLNSNVEVNESQTANSTEIIESKNIHKTDIDIPSKYTDRILESSGTFGENDKVI